MLPLSWDTCWINFILMFFHEWNKFLSRFQSNRMLVNLINSCNLILFSIETNYSQGCIKTPSSMFILLKLTPKKNCWNLIWINTTRCNCIWHHKIDTVVQFGVSEDYCTIIQTSKQMYRIHQLAFSLLQDLIQMYSRTCTTIFTRTHTGI